jgi:Fe-S-cluster containining protein
MDSKEIRRIFYRDGYRLAHEYLSGGLSSLNALQAIFRLYEVMDELLDAFLQRTAGEGSPASCKKGCAWCCNQEVFAVTHEFLYIREYVFQYLTEQERNRILERAREKLMQTVHLPVDERHNVRAACPFLEDNSCMVYAARPMACRIYLSSSLSSCMKVHKGPANGKAMAELFEFPLLSGRMLNEGFVAYLKQSGIRSAELPLEQGYASMLGTGQTMEEWIGSARE